jgi:mono/diheme cytochrome c family protein
MRVQICQLLPLALCLAASAAAEQGPERPVDFVRDVRPILAKNCFACHGPDEHDRQAELRLDTPEGAFGELNGNRPFTPSDADASEALRRITSTDEGERMPPADSGKTLTAEEIETIRRWIEQGAAWKSHWAFEKPVQAPLPDVSDPAWCKTEWDRFVLALLDREGLGPSPEADRYTLARRVALDLTGLPPPPEVVREFVNDPLPEAYERLVDRLLNSPAYGERWARVWLDLARYADTRGYEKDRTRTMWPYRDWVIEAFNRDLPYDQFTREQLAGDLLPEPTQSQLVATAFHRNTMVNEEGGTDDEEFRVAAVKDRVDTTLQVWMGLTMGCAKCHSHKYDPISQREYYQFYAFFNQTEDSDRGDERPTLPITLPDQERKRRELAAAIKEIETRLASVTPELQQAAETWAAEMRPQSGGWIALKPREMKAASGSTLTLQEDGSVLASAESPAKETYTLSLPLEAGTLTGIRLEALPDKSHPKAGVGRSPGDGNFVLSGIRVELAPRDESPIALPLAKAEADFSQDGYPVAHAIKNDNPTKHGWAVSPKQSEPHTAVFTLEKSPAVEAGAELIVTLDHQFEFAYPGFSLGRFRLSVTGDQQPALHPALPENIAALVRLVPAERSEAQSRQLHEYFAANVAPANEPLRTELARLRAERAAIKPIPLPVMRELAADKRRTTNIHIRGSFLDQGEPVGPAALPSFHSWPDDAPLTRVGVAEWLTSRENPLTARVAVNRHWAYFFGRGLVETEEDFGSQGQPPTHPELLDWLAVEFMDQGWSFKKLCKQMVMSATYRQSSRVTPELVERDRFNRLLARGPRFRLEAEMVRDNALAVSGLLSRKMFGPSVMPMQPEGIWRSTYNTDKWITSPGEDRYRRSLYTFIKRTSPYPAMVTFDAPSREICSIRRVATNTPLQALVTLNDPVYVEAAQSLARKMKTSGGATLHEQLAFGLQTALIRPARDEEVRLLAELYARRLAEFQANSAAAEQLATDPLGPLPDGMDAAELAALTAVANVILNLDEFLTRS